MFIEVKQTPSIDTENQENNSRPLIDADLDKYLLNLNTVVKIKKSENTTAIEGIKERVNYYRITLLNGDEFNILESEELIQFLQN